MLLICVARADTSQIAAVNKLLANIESNIPEQYRYPESIIEGKNWQQAPEFNQLKSIISTSWPYLLSNIQVVAPTEINKLILFSSFQSLPADEYLSFLDQAVALAEVKTIDKRLLQWALMPGDKNVRGVLAYNYDKPVSKDILTRVEKLFSNDPNILKFCGAILSGESKKTAEEYFKNNINDPRPKPANKAVGQNDFELPSYLSNGTKLAPRPATTPPRVAEQPLPSFPTVPVAIVVAVIVGILLFILRRKST